VEIQPRTIAGSPRRRTSDPSQRRLSTAEKDSCTFRESLACHCAKSDRSWHTSALQLLIKPGRRSGLYLLFNAQIAEHSNRA
jgi:hypothetical protein